MAAYQNIQDLIHPDLVDIERFLTQGYGYAVYGSKDDNVGQPCAPWQEMAHDWSVIYDLLGGTRGMRLAAERRLPRFDKETDQEYIQRKETSFLIDVLDDTLDDMVSKPFSKAISFIGKVPSWVEEFNKNVDGLGTTIDECAKNVFLDAMKWGKSHAVVDAVDMPESLPEQPLVGDFAGAHARVRMVPGPNLLSWKFADGRQLAAARIFSRSFSEEVVEFVHEWSPIGVSEWSRPWGEFPWKRGPTKPHGADVVPLATMYTKRSGELTAKPPFMDLAWVSVDHWQSYSDQRQILHIARVPLLFAKLLGTPKKGAAVAGARRLIRAEDEKADLRYVEPGGSAMLEGREHLKMLMESAKEKGAKPLRALSPMTATGEVRQESKASCDLQAWVEALERFLLNVYRLAARVVPGQELPEDFKPQVFKEFDLRDRSGVDLAGLRLDRQRGDISREAYIAEAVRRGLLPQDFDEEADKALLDKEAAEGMDAMEQEASILGKTAPE